MCLGGTREREGTYAPIGYLRVQNVFSFDSHSKDSIEADKFVSTSGHVSFFLFKSIDCKCEWNTIFK